jgi:hypothetical protein
VYGSVQFLEIRGTAEKLSGCLPQDLVRSRDSFAGVKVSREVPISDGATMGLTNDYKRFGVGSLYPGRPDARSAEPAGLILIDAWRELARETSQSIRRERSEFEEWLERRLSRTTFE